MPLSKTIDIDEQTKLGLWHIKEDADFFLSRLQLDDEEQAKVDQLKSPKRYLHWLASRVLIRTLINTEEFIEMTFEANGKPKLQNFPYNVSISHSLDYAGVILSERQDVGIDIEKIDPKINRIAHKFIPDNELNKINKVSRMETYHVHWGAKEAMFKVCGQPGVSFKDHIQVDPIDYNNSGSFKGGIANYGLSCSLNYEKFNDYMLVYAICN